MDRPQQMTNEEAKETKSTGQSIKMSVAESFMSVDLADYSLRIGIFRGFLHTAHFPELRDEIVELL